MYQILEVRLSDGPNDTRESIPCDDASQEGMTGISTGEKIISQVCVFHSLSQRCQHHNHCVLIYNTDFWSSCQALPVFRTGLKEFAFEKLPRWYPKVRGLWSR